MIDTLPLKRLPIVLAGVVAAGIAGCAHVKVDPIQVQTIHIVHDVNLNVDKALEDFFAFQEQQGATKPVASTQPATQPAASAGDVK